MKKNIKDFNVGKQIIVDEMIASIPSNLDVIKINCLKNVLTVEEYFKEIIATFISIGVYPQFISGHEEEIWQLFKRRLEEVLSKGLTANNSNLN